MGYFLFARTADGAFRQISGAFFESRSEALSELAKLTSEPDFDFWDDEVFVADLDNAAPVLLVRPPAPVQPQTDVQPEDAAQFEPETESESDPVPESGPPSLAEALKGAATALESEGIVAPASIDAVSALEELYSEAAIPAPDEVETCADDEMPTDEPPDDEPPAEESPLEAEPVPVGEWPWDVATHEDAAALPEQPELSESDEPAQTSSGDEGEQAEGVEDESIPDETVAEEYALDPLEEPSVDDAGFLPPVPDAEGISVRPVILGDYDAPTLSDDDPVQSPDEETQPADTMLPVTEGMTCDDCVYVATCPHKDERDPSTCGSFQWVSA